MGIVADRGGVSISNSEVSFNKVAGVHIGAGSSLTVDGSTFSSNGAHGLGVFNASVAMLWDTKITSNGTDPAAFFRQGVYIYFSHAEFRDGSIADNAGVGMVVSGSAHVFNTIITGNGDGGISAPFGSNLAIDGATISGNKGNGVVLDTNSTGQISNETKIQDNSGHGIAVIKASKLLLWSPIAVGGNAGFGLYCDSAESSAAAISWISFSPPNSAGDVSQIWPGHRDHRVSADGRGPAALTSRRWRSASLKVRNRGNGRAAACGRTRIRDRRVAECHASISSLRAPARREP